jgi:HEAT repeats
VSKSKPWIYVYVLSVVAVLALLKGGLTTSAMAQPRPTPNVQRWVDESIVIVKGRVLYVHEIGTKGLGASMSRTMSASVQVDSVLKGNVNGSAITIEFQESHGTNTIFPNEYELRPDQYALLFLTGGQNGRYLFADPYTGAMPITSDRVPAAETAHTTEGSVEAVLFASLSDPDRNVAETALQQVGNLNKVRSTEALRKIATSSDPAFQSLAYAALINLGDYSLLDQAIKFAEEHVDQMDGIPYAIDLIGDKRIREASKVPGGAGLECSSKTGLPFDRSVLPLLHSLLSSPNTDLRRSSVHALRGICDPSSARFMVRALDDSNRDVQYDAMMMLGALEDYPANLPAPATGLFNENPADYLNVWKRWWQTEGKRKYASTP